MSDSSEDEDLSKFREAVDNSFMENINCVNNTTQNDGSTDNCTNKKSEKYLEESAHYNDVKVSDELQRRIGAKLSEIIKKNTEFVDVNTKVKKRKIKGGVKLFTSSEGYLNCEEIEDTDTIQHNKMAKQIHKHNQMQELNGNDIDKLKSVAVSGEHVLSEMDTKYWKSRRKPKIYKYKSNSKNNVLHEIE